MFQKEKTNLILEFFDFILSTTDNPHLVLYDLICLAISNFKKCLAESTEISMQFLEKSFNFIVHLLVDYSRILCHVKSPSDLIPFMIQSFFPMEQSNMSKKELDVARYASKHLSKLLKIVDCFDFHSFTLFFDRIMNSVCSEMQQDDLLYFHRMFKETTPLYYFE